MVAYLRHYPRISLEGLEKPGKILIRDYGIPESNPRPFECDSTFLLLSSAYTGQKLLLLFGYFMKLYQLLR
jgi:hypothetical protein